MTELAGVMAAAAEVEAFCRARGWRYCFIGGVAVQRWGMPRFTQDVDLTLLVRLGSEERFIEPLLLDLDLARRELPPLLALKEDSGSLAKLERMIDVIRDRLDPRHGNKLEAPHS